MRSSEMVSRLGPRTATKSIAETHPASSSENNGNSTRALLHAAAAPSKGPFSSISRLMRCTVPVPTLSSRAMASMPFLARTGVDEACRGASTHQSCNPQQVGQVSRAPRLNTRGPAHRPGGGAGGRGGRGGGGGLGLGFGGSAAALAANWRIAA
jgi:hypothetical protein